jgi:V8-like Glu-specific endopeptidase
MTFTASQYPYSTVVYITDTIGGLGYQASGVMLSPDEVLTAAHVVYQAGTGGASSITVRPGYNAGSAPYGSASASWFHYFKIQNADNLISNSDSQYDYAIIHLSSKLNAGTMGYLSNFAGGAVHVTGFPASSGGQMIDFTENVRLDPNFTLLDGGDTGHGSSGGPVWVLQNGSPYVVGLVSSGNGTTGYNMQITSQAFQQISAWIGQDDYVDPLVDTTYYTSHNADVANAPINKAWHYDAYGWQEGRNPNAIFNTTAYEAAYADVRNAGINPLAHYDSYGWREGRDPSANFDSRLYLIFNPDVARAGIDPMLHWITFGQSEHRKVAPAVGPGISAGFDPTYYKLANPDVGLVGIDPAAHWRSYGWHENRNPDAFFDTAYYLAHNADVRAAGIDPLAHYMTYGWKEHRNPSTHFLTDSYLSHYNDVNAAHANPLQHFLQFGIAEGRSGFGDLV